MHAEGFTCYGTSSSCCLLRSQRVAIEATSHRTLTPGATGTQHTPPCWRWRMETARQSAGGAASVRWELGQPSLPQLCAAASLRLRLEQGPHPLAVLDTSLSKHHEAERSIDHTHAAHADPHHKDGLGARRRSGAHASTNAVERARVARHARAPCWGTLLQRYMCFSTVERRNTIFFFDKDRLY